MLVGKVQANLIQQKICNRKNVTNPSAEPTITELSKGIDSKSYVNINFKGELDLMVAAKNGDFETVCNELDQGTDVNYANIHGVTALMLACSKGREDVILRLLEHPDINVNAKADEGSTALIVASYNGFANIVKRLLQCPNIDISAADDLGTAADNAMKTGFPEIADMIKAYAALKSPKKLFQAVIDGDLDAVNRELDKGVDVNAKSDAGVTALMRACMKGFDKIVERLLQHPMIDVNALTGGGRTALMWASENGSDNIVEKLLRHPGIDVNIKSKYTNDTALIEACYKGHTKVVEKLLEHPDVDIDAAQHCGQTARSIARDRGDTDIINMLRDYERGVDRRACSRPKQNTPQQPSGKVQNKNPFGMEGTTLEKLERALASIDPMIKSDALEDLIEHIQSDKFDAKYTDSFGRNIIHLSLLSRDERVKTIISKAIGKGISINSQNITGQTPLMMAIKNFLTAKNEEEKPVDLSNIKYILDQNPDVNIQDKNGQTAFHLACMSTSAALLTLILSRNPNILLKDVKGNIGAKYLKTDALKEVYEKFIRG